jgi:F-type H+-transporting ATPase subunit a
MKRVKAIKANTILKVIALIVPLLLSINSFTLASTPETPAAPQSPKTEVAAPQTAAAPAEGAEGEEKAGDVIMHHILDNHILAFEPFGEIELPKIVVGGFDLSITKHVVMLWVVSAILIALFALAGAKT